MGRDSRMHVWQVLQGCRSVSLGHITGLRRICGTVGPLVVGLMCPCTTMTDSSDGHSRSSAQAQISPSTLAAAACVGAVLLAEDDASDSSEATPASFRQMVAETIARQPLTLDPAHLAGTCADGTEPQTARRTRDAEAAKLVFLADCVRWDASAADTLLATRLLLRAIANLRLWYAAAVVAEPAPGAEGAGEGAFLPVASYEGSRDGYVFKNGEKGLGYYKDADASSAKGAAAVAQGGEGAVEAVEALVVRMCGTILRGLVEVKGAHDLFASAAKLVNGWFDSVIGDRLLNASSVCALQAVLQLAADQVRAHLYVCLRACTRVAVNGGFTGESVTDSVGVHVCACACACVCARGWWCCVCVCVCVCVCARGGGVWSREHRPW